MERITLNNVVADIFTQCKDIRSDVWNNTVCFERGKSYLIEAQSGTGKSTLCSFIYGLRNDYSGSILFDNEDIADFNAKRWSALHRESLSILFQDLRLFPELTALENVDIKNNLTLAQDRSTIDRWFEELGISDKRDTVLSRLSFGQRQRVAFIRALCQPMDFIILDEPVSHLDSRNGEIMKDILLAEAARRNAGIIVTSIGNRLSIAYDKILSL